ncbi:MAG: demethoxyubiquinone hydroxylase family protein [Alphaproteobacteria bacterium]|nr:demethoxyubiquinone hydroxylase family protein [Alphaproteobacteria bacterium]
MIRVDHAGEYGAVKIYQGQAAIFDIVKSKRKTAALIRDMAEQEEAHLEIFDDLLRQRKIRPTALAPVWDIAGFTLGAATALMGEKAAMACTAAVEEVIDEHYASQIEELAATDSEPELQATLAQCRADEAAHHRTAIEEGAEQAFGYPILRASIKAGCQLAIKLSEKI